MSSGEVAGRLRRRARRTTSSLLERLGVGESSSTRLGEADEYWSEPGSAKWRSDSHWRDSPVFGAEADWWSIGDGHVELTQRLAPGALAAGERPRVLEWGVGGGANAVHFAPLASEFIAVDVSQESLDECARQVTATCATPLRSVLVDIADPEAVGVSAGSCDLFLCFYVFELVPSADYGLRLLRLAHRLLAPGGVAMIQIKYATVDRRTRSHTRSYRRNVGSMTTYPIDEFWLHAERAGFAPSAVALVPKNRLDEHYAYFAMSKAPAADGG